MTDMRLRNRSQLEGSEGISLIDGPHSQTGNAEQSTVNRGRRSSRVYSDTTTLYNGRRRSVVTFDVDPVIQTFRSRRPITNEDGNGGTDWQIKGDSRRMSAPELPPIRQNPGKISSSLLTSRSLLKNHSSGSLSEQRGINTRSPSQRSSSSSLSNIGPQNSSTSGVSWQQPNDQSLKLETLFEKRIGGMRSEPGTPRTVSSQGGYNLQKLGKMPSITKFVNNNTSRFDRMSIRDSKRTYNKKTSTLPHSVSETHLLSKAKGRLKSKFGMSSTSSVYNNNYSNNNNSSVSHMNLSRNSSDQRLKEKTKNARNHIKPREIPGSTKNGFTNKSGTVNGMRKYSSTFALNTLNQNGSKDDDEPDDDQSEEEEENDKRIRDWLMGADCADAPPEPEINYADEPPQTDTALHVVYDGD